MMDGNKDEALKCIRIAKEAIASGNKDRAIKFIRIAQRLNCNLSVDDLFTSCEKMDASGSSTSGTGAGYPVAKCPTHVTPVKIEETSNGERNYTKEHVTLIRQVNRIKDYYTILGVEKTCSVEEIRKAYRKLSLKVHPDKNKTPGAEEAFKKVCKAFKCLSDEGSRRQYDQIGLVDEFEFTEQHNVRRSRRTNDFFEDEFDPDEIFRAFFGQPNVFHSSHVYRARGMGTQQRTEGNGGGPNSMVFLQLIPFLFILLLAYLTFSDPVYSLQRSYSHQFLRVTEKHGVEYFVKSSEFDRDFPLGSAARDNVEDNVIQDYKSSLGRYCHIELRRRQWSRNLPTPHCDKLQSFGVA